MDEKLWRTFLSLGKNISVTDPVTKRVEFPCVKCDIRHSYRGGPQVG